MSEQLVQVVLDRLQFPRGSAADFSSNEPPADGRASPDSRAGPYRAAVLVSGAIGEGKTSAVSFLAEQLVRRGISVDGVLALRILDREAGRTIGYDLIAIRSGYRIPLAREHSPGQKAGRFFLREDALREAERILRNAAVTQSVVILDEVGRLEMTGGGHAPALEAVLAGSALPVLTIRRSLVGQMRDRLGASAVDCVDVVRGELLNGREGGS